MPAVLGIYAKKGEIEKEKIKEVLADFSLNKRRKLQTYSDKKLILSVMKTGNNEPRIIEDNSSIMLLGGYIYEEDVDKKIKKLENKGYKFKNKHNLTEFFLYSYKEYKKKFLKEVNGIYSFVIYNKLKDELILGNDSFGFYPLFIYDSEKYLIFSSEYEPITRYKAFDKKLNYDAIAEYFAFGTTIGDKTFFKSINNLHPGSLLIIRKGNITVKRYENLKIQVEKNKDINYFAKKINDSIKKAVQLRIKNIRNPSISISGGADTRLILANLTNDQRKSVSFHHYKPTILEEDECRDTIVAKMLAKHFNIKLKMFNKKTELPVDYLGTDFFRKGRVKTYKPILTGMYGGEFLGGDCFKCFPTNIRNVNEEATEQTMHQWFDERILKKISNICSSFYNELEGIEAENKELLFLIYNFSRAFFSLIYGGSRGIWLEPHQLFMKYESIYTDKNFLKTLLTVPQGYIFDYQIYNALYKNHYKSLCKIPMNSPLARKKGSVVPLIKTGIEQKFLHLPKYNTKILHQYLKGKSLDRGFYNKRFVTLTIDEFSIFKRRFIDFECWRHAYVLPES